MKTGRDAARSLALLRGDTSWLKIASFMDAGADNATKLFDKRQMRVN